MYKELVEYIVKSLVDYPEEVRVSEVRGATSIVLELTVSESDMGRVIGKNGRVVNSIRTILQVLAAKQGNRITLEII